MTPLPIDAILPDAIARLREKRALVLVAEPGAGKTTRVPPAVLKARLLDTDNPNLIHLQPRRVAARAAAARIADENNWTLGREVGYHIRFERKVSADTRLHVMTEGVLTRRLLDDPILEEVGCVVLDEFHERSLHTDLAVALLKEIRDTVRPDLMLIVMSATLDAEPVARFLGDVPIVRSEGRTFPVEIMHAGTTPRVELPQRIADLIAADEGDGDTLVFLPGVAEINRTIDALDLIARRDNLLVLPLHGALSGDEQFAALRPSERRKIVVATNIAETSLTIDGVTSVIDSGLARVAGYDPARGMDRLELKRISRASATQRSGRAGRTRAGRCIRLWSAGEERAMDDFETPEIRRVDLCGTVLALHAWGHPDPRTLDWYEPPDERALLAAERLLEMLGATSETAGRITEIGKRMLALPLHPRLARLMLAAAEWNMLECGAAIAALLSEKDIVRIRTDMPYHDRRPSTQSDSDLLIRLDILESRRRDSDIDAAALRQVQKTRDELLRIGNRLSPSPRTRGEGRGEGQGARGCGNRKIEDTPGRARADRRQTPQTPLPCPLPGVPGRGSKILQLPLFAYPDRVCRRRANDPAAGVMVGGGGVRLAPECTVRKGEFFLALDARQDERNPKSEAIVRVASRVEAGWLEEFFPQEIRRERNLIFDEQRQRVIARGVTSYRDLVLREDADAPVEPAQAGEVLAAALAPGARELIEADEDAARLLARVALLRQHMPEHPWPTFDDGELADIVTDAAAGKRSVEEVRRALLPSLQSRLVYPLDRLLDQQAPEMLTAPSGSRIRITYSADQPPVLAARLQELFGWTETPRIAGGRVPIRLHLLGPNFRPVQITDDLKSFWATTYFQVRKDLRVRYPKHAWPENPLTAKPEAKGRHRST